MKKIILFVDDVEPFDEKVIRGRLAQQGYEVKSYAGGREAIRAILEGIDYDLLLIDFSLPDTDGEEVVKFSRQVNPCLPVIGWSACIDREGMAMGGTDWNIPLPPDGDFSRLFAVIQRFLK